MCVYTFSKTERAPIQSVHCTEPNTRAQSSIPKEQCSISSLNGRGRNADNITKYAKKRLTERISVKNTSNKLHQINNLLKYSQKKRVN